jgi:predicted nuclease of restriction endonuclease-like (RecB) superfamily
MKTDDEFFDRVASLIEQARGFVGRTVDLTMCITYYEIGRIIVELEQDGKARAEYGRGLLKELSVFLEGRFGKGYSVSTLTSARKFYQTYAPSISQTPFAILGSDDSARIQKSQTVFAKSYPFKLGWSHYLILMRMKSEKERQFYEVEAAEQQWSVRQLSRQYNSSLYERIALSRDKNEVMRLAAEGQTIEKSRDILKNPLVLEFLDLEESDAYSETDLESALNTHLQKFLLELGRAFYSRHGKNGSLSMRSHSTLTSFFTTDFSNAMYLST